MSLDFTIAREFFELHGFSVRAVRQDSSQARGKRLAEEEVDLHISNPEAFAPAEELPFFLFPSTITQLDHAWVLLRDWNTQVRFPTTLSRSGAEIAQFVEKIILKRPAETFDLIAGNEVEKAHKILLLPGLPALPKHREQVEDLLRTVGVEHAMSFRTLLMELLKQVNTDIHYRHSPFHEAVRILKCYELIQPPQFEL